MAEKDMRGKITKALKSLDAIAVENRVFPGTPDVNHINGWIELKWLRAWPKRDATIPKFKHWTQEQRSWIMRRWRRAPGTVHVMIQCRREWFLFTGPKAVQLINNATRQQLTEGADLYMPVGLDEEVLLQWLERHRFPTESGFDLIESSED